MWLSIGEVAADADDEHGSIAFADGVLALFRRFVGIHPQEFLTVDEMYFFGQKWGNLWIGLAHEIFRAADGAVDAADDFFQEVDGAFLTLDGAAPVPLVHIEGVDVVEFLVASDGVHVGVETIARTNFVFCKHQALPFGERVHHFSHLLSHVLDRKLYWAFHAVQIIVDS